MNTAFPNQEEYLFYGLALRSIPHIGNTKAKRILSTIEHPKLLFNLSVSTLMHDFSLSAQDAKSIHQYKDFGAIEKESAFIRKHNIKVSFFHQDTYPKNLQMNDDSPFVLFSLGNCSIENKKIITIIGTRTNSAYGKKITEQLICDLAKFNIVIVSGLAKGIDSIAHQAALHYQVPTIGVLGHGLQTIYPSSNKDLAKKMIQESGALYSEFFSTVHPSKETFPIRNRIVAAFCDALIVIETKKKGGSIITANYANDYNKDVFAIPGRIDDERSEGCNYLIQTQKAFLLNNANDLIEMMNWQVSSQPKIISQELFTHLNYHQKTIIKLLQQEQKKTHLDLLITQTQIPFSVLSAELLDLEFNGRIQSLPGKFYTLI